MVDTLPSSGGVELGPVFLGILIFAILLAITALALVLYGRFYRRRLDRALREDAPVSAPAPEPRRAGTLILWLAAAACLAVLLVRVGTLQKRLESQEYSLQQEQLQLQSLENSVRTDMDRLSEKIDVNNQELLEQLRRLNSIFLRTDYEMRVTNLNEGLVSLYVCVVPKTASPDTDVSLRLNGASFPLTRQEDGSYRDILELSLYDLSTVFVGELCLTEDGVERREELRLDLPNAYDFIPVQYVSFSGDVGGKNRKVMNLTVEAALRSSRLRSLSLQVRDSSGEVLQEKDLMPELAGAELYDEAYHLRTEFNGTFSAEGEITLLICLEDEDGLRYEKIFARLVGGELFKDNYEWIFNSDGAVIWEAAG